MAKVKEYRTPKDKTNELLAIKLFEQHAQYGCGWMELAEETRNYYRGLADGSKKMIISQTNKTGDPVIVDEDND